MDYKEAADYWKNKISNVAPDDVILKSVDNILNGFRHCTLATLATSIQFSYTELYHSLKF